VVTMNKPLAAIILFAAGLAAVLLMPDPLVSPGQLSQGHAKQDKDCFSCHSPFLGPRDDKCIACHKVEDIGLKKTGGKEAMGERAKKVAFHRRLAERSCSGCHTDHKGRKAAKATRQFNHGLLEKNYREVCDQCHVKPADTLHRPLTANCGSCHGTEKWKPATFDHDRYFRFDRDHPPECKSCHLGKDYKTYTCYECHEHSERNVREEHLEEGIRDFAKCTDCHRSADEDEAERIWEAMKRGGRKSKGGGKGRERDDD